MTHQWTDSDLYLNCHVSPNAKSDGFIGIHDNRLKFTLKATAIEGKANRHFLKFLSQEFKVPQNRVQIVSGELGRKKRVKIEGAEFVPDYIESNTSLRP